MAASRRRTIAPSPPLIVLGALALVVYVVIIAFWVYAGLIRPERGAVPVVFRPLISPRDAFPITALAVSAVVAFLTLGRLPRVRPVRGTLAVGVLLVSAGAVAFATYLPCDDDESPFWTAVRRALDLVRGELDQPFEVGGSCAGAVPLGLQAAELMMIIAFALVAYRAIGLVFARQLDRVRIARARRLVLFSGLTAETTSFAAARVDASADAVLPVVLHERGDRRATAIAETLGGIAIPLEVTDAESVRRFVSGRHRRSIRGVHLLDADSAVNLEALAAFQRALPADSTGAIPNRILVRIDDPWYADDWRRKHIASVPGWLIDAVSAVEAGARAVVAELIAEGVDTLVVTGASQFELAVLSELALRARTADAVGGDEPPRFALIAVGDEALRTADHLEHQVGRFGTTVSGLSRPSRARTLEEAMKRGDARAAILVDPTTTAVEEARNPSFLAARRPTWRIYAWADGVGSGVQRTIADLRVVHPTLDDALVPVDLWERFGRLAHERYLTLHHGGVPVDGDPSRGSWDQLSMFARESNIRSFSALIAAMPLLGRRWSTTFRPERDAAADLTDAELERLAIAEHESWTEHLVEHRWRYGSERDVARRRHPSLRPWSELTPEEQEKDRTAVRTTAALLRALGFTMELDTRQVDGSR